MRILPIIVVLALFTLTGAGCKDAKSGDAAAGHEGHAKAAAGAAAVVAPKNAKVFFVEPADGAVVKSPVKVKFGVDGMKVQAAGELVDGTGHHHVIIDGKALDLGAVVPKDETNLHYGKGELEAELTLSAGEHTLTMQFADGAHRSYGPGMSATIKVTVAP